MELWNHWLKAVEELRPSCSRRRTFFWLVVVLAAMTTRCDQAGVTSFVRSHWLKGKCYDSLRKFFHSHALKLDTLTDLWITLCLKLFAAHLFRINNRLVIIADGIKIPKEGKKMPAVKSLHQESQSNSKPEFIMGHSCQALSLLIKGNNAFFAVPLLSRIHEGLVFSNRSCQTLLDKLVAMLLQLEMGCYFYLVADAYYANKKVALPLLAENQHLVARVRTNAVGYFAAAKPKQSKKRPKGRPKVYGRKVRIRNQFKADKMTAADSPVYGEKGVQIRYRSMQLLWKPLGRLVQFILVEHPTRGRMILFTTDLSLAPLDAIKLYGLRFKIEVSFRQAIYTVGTYAYHFWMASMKPIKRRDGDQYLHRESEEYRKRIKVKMDAYHRHIQIGLIAQGLLQYLAVSYPALVWKSFGSWLRTMRPDLEPSEMVVAKALTNRLPYFLANLTEDHFLRKFLSDKLEPERCPELLLGQYLDAA
jgi:hypothetical protein